MFPGEILNGADLNAATRTYSATELSGSADSRLPVTKFFPDFSFRSPVKYQIRNTDPDGRFLVGSTLHDDTNWLDARQQHVPAGAAQAGAIHRV